MITLWAKLEQGRTRQRDTTEYSSIGVVAMPNRCWHLANEFTKFQSRPTWLLAMGTPVGLRMSDRCSGGGGIIWSHAVFSCLLIMVFSRTLLLVTFGSWHELSDCRLVCRWRCCTLGTDWTFRQYFLHRLIAQGLGQFVLNIGAKIRRSFRGSCKLNTRKYEKLACF